MIIYCTKQKTHIHGSCQIFIVFLWDGFYENFNKTHGKTPAVESFLLKTQAGKFTREGLHCRYFMNFAL